MSILVRLTAACGIALLAGCSGGGSTGVKGTSGDFLVLRTTPPNNGRLFLNEPIRLDLSNEIDLSTADLNTVSFQVFNLNGTALTERPVGTFSLGRSAGDDEAGRQLVFTPRFPTNNTFDNGGFRPGRLYVVQLVSGDARNGTVLRDVNGQGLAQPVTFQFRTADGTSPSELFSDTRPGGPTVISSVVTPRDPGNDDRVHLNRASQEPVEIRLEFDQPVNPADTNLPVNVSANPVERSLEDRGRLFLEYDDPTGRNTWIPATIDLERNERSGSTVVIRPIGVLPNNAEVRVIVDSTFEDMSGESNASDASYDRVVRRFETVEAFDPAYDAYIERFDAATAVDLEAPFLEPLAQVADGRISASFAFEGSESRLRYEPRDRSVILNTNFTQITPVDNPPINVSDGIFQFASVTIPDGVHVQGVGTNPMTWLVTGDFEVAGTLSVDGGDGDRVNSLNAPNVPTAGGIGVCGGGNGGRGSPDPLDRSPLGEAGFGPNQVPEGGGEPGRLSCESSCNRGSAGGGGSYATEGDPFYPPDPTATRWPQTDGIGGTGCLNRTLPGGQPGPLAFTDSRDDNDFWGVGVNVFRQIRLEGELLLPRGGSGGGGGGDRSSSCRVPDPSGFLNDNKGGGGGGGAGVLIVKALGKIIVRENGRISADGGHGGGGEQAGGNNEGGGGGAGSGGMVVLMAGQGIDIETHVGPGGDPLTDATYGEDDFAFAITADGGIGTQGRFGGTEILEKYDPVGNPQWNAKPTGGFGGLGVVQLMVPPGEDADGTGNRLDDNIRFLYRDSGVWEEVPAARKVELLAWRGWPDQTGQRTDDNGNPIDIGNDEGDIRPSPIMLPSPFGAVSRARSRWVDLGFVVRERIDPGSNSSDPRVVRAAPGEAPRPDFGDPDLGYGSTSSRPDDAGYARYDDSSGELQFPEIELSGTSEFAVASVDADATFQGGAAYRLEVPVGSPIVNAETDRYANYRAEWLDGNGASLGDLRILGHTARSVWVEPRETFPGEPASFRILVKFFNVTVEGQPGLGPTFPIDQSTSAPVANVRVGFAFSTDPEAGAGPTRWPNGTDPSEGLFEYDLLDPDFHTWLETNRPQFVQWDVLFNTRFHPTLPNNRSGQPLDAEMPLPQLDYLALPYRF